MKNNAIKQILSYIAMICILLSFTPVLASENDSSAVACLESKDGQVLKTYTSLQAAINAITEDGQVAKLLKDTNIRLTKIDGFRGWSAFGLIDYNNKKVNKSDILITLDLNGHTITFKDYSGNYTLYGLTAIDFEKAVIKNGKIVFDFEPLPSPDLFKYCSGIQLSGSTTLENLEITTVSQKQLYGAICSNSKLTDSSVTLRNCTIDNDGGEIFNSSFDMSSITIESGCYDNFKSDKVSIANGSKILKLDNVNETVIVSPTTQAIVIKDAKAYTFDDTETAKLFASGEDDVRLFVKQSDTFSEVNIDSGNIIVRVTSEDDFPDQVSGDDSYSKIDIILENNITVSNTVVLSGGVLDLNGNTITIKPSGNAAVTMVGGKIINGTIIVDYSNMSSPTYGIYSSSENATKLENVEIITMPGTELDAAIGSVGFINLDNCVIADVSIKENGSMFKSPNATDFTVSSGTYKNMSHSGLDNAAVDGDTVSPSAGSNEITVNGVDNTVIVSGDTEAIVVKDNKVYTYNTVEDAKQNSGGADSILLEKQENGEFVGSTADANWSYDTDSGYYSIDDSKIGTIRFLFDTGVNLAEIKSSGIKFTKSSDITETITDTNLLKGTASSFYGDITNISENDNDMYYAIAYVELTNGTIKWSTVISCKPDFDTAISQ